MTHKKLSPYRPANCQVAGGFTLIELMIVIAIVAIILSLALPVYSNYVIRTKVAEGLSIANASKTAVSAICVEDRKIPALNNGLAGYQFEETIHGKAYVKDVQTTGPCTNPLITVTTKNTGQSPDPIILMTGELPASSGHFKWTCSSDNAPDWLLPKTCRSSG